MQTARKRVLDIRDIIDHELSADYDFVHFLTDFRSVIKDESFSPITECVLPTKSKSSDDSCFVMRRHARSKALFSADSLKNNALFFVGGVDSESAVTSIATQQCLDCAHIFLAHHLKLDLMAIATELETETADADDDELDVNHL